MAWFSVVTALVTLAHARPTLTKIGSCAKTDSPKTVRIIKQWPLSPAVITREFKERYPQERNQTAIYQALADDVKKRKLDLVVGEGCEGTLDQNFTGVFNGWSFENLRKIAQTRGFDRIIASVPLKLAARFGDKISAKCGDDEALIQEGNLHVTNLRGWTGYLTNLRKTFIDDRGKLYADQAADLLKVPRTTLGPDIITLIKDKVRQELAAFRGAIAKRNDGFVKVASPSEAPRVAIVINGLHAEDLKTKLQTAGFNCETLEPAGYQREDERLIQEFERALSE